MEFKTPVYNEKETINQYLRKVQIFEINLKKAKYQLILDFINDWLENDEFDKFSSLKEFSKIKKDTLFKSSEHNEKIIKEYTPRIKKIFNIKYTPKKDDSIIQLLSKMLIKIDYKLINYDKKGIKYFTIII